MAMDPTTAERRRRRRRVADVDRKRAPRACTRCKRRKSKCVQAKGSSRSDKGTKCQRCSIGNLDCKFEQEDMNDVEGILQPPQPEKQSSTTPRNTTSGVSDDATVEDTELPSPASVLSQGLSKHVIADQSKRVLWPNVLSRLREAFSLDSQDVPEERDMVAMQARMICPKELRPAELSRLHAAIDAFPPRPVADFLLFVFMKHATDVFFYFDQAQVLSDIDEFYTKSASPLRLDPAFVCLALAAFALGSQWTPLERPEGLEFDRQRENGNVGRSFASHAKSLIPDIIERSCLRSIQAPFVLGVYFMPESAIGTSYVFLGLALRKAVASDLHIGSEDPIMNEREREVRCRLWWSIYSLERCTTVKLNRPRSIDTKIIKVPYPSQCTMLDREQSFENLECQVAYIHLIMILDQIAGVEDELTRSTNLSQANWENDLKEWKRSLPLKFKLDQMSASDFNYRAVSHLYLNYYYAWITVGKVALVTIARKKLKQSDRDTPDINDKANRLANGCMKAARKTLQLFENLTRNRKITRFSFTDFQGCSIAIIVTLVAGIFIRDSGYDTRVEFGLSCLRKMATGNMTAKLGVRFVEAVRSITDEAATKLERDSLLTQDTSGLNIHSGYSDWRGWLTAQESCARRDYVARTQANLLPSRENNGRDLYPWLGALPAHSGGTSSWNPESDTSSFIPGGLNDLESPTASHPLELDFLSTLHNDDQSFLMGLTGLDALDFSGLTVQLE